MRSGVTSPRDKQAVKGLPDETPREWRSVLLPRRRTAGRKGPEMAVSKTRAAARPLADLARSMFHPTDRQPYWLGDRAIGNLEELAANVEKFGEEQAAWVADWLDYLGDAEVARRIRVQAARLRPIVTERYRQLKEALDEEKKWD